MVGNPSASGDSPAADRHRTRRKLTASALSQSNDRSSESQAPEGPPIKAFDILASVPREVVIKILRSLDATSICRAASVSRVWQDLADDFQV